MTPLTHFCLETEAEHLKEQIYEENMKRVTFHFLGLQNLCRNWLQPCIGRTDAEAETLTLWPSHVKSWLIGKDPDAGRDWRQEEKGMTEGEMVGRHHQLNGHGFGWTLGVGDGQGGLACCASWIANSQTWLKRLSSSSSIYFSSVQFSHSVVSDSLWPHELQHARPPCTSPTPGVHSNSCALSGNAIQPSHPLSSPSPASNPSQHQSLFQWVNSLHEVAKVLEFQL